MTEATTNGRPAEGIKSSGGLCGELRFKVEEKATYRGKTAYKYAVVDENGKVWSRSNNKKFIEDRCEGLNILEQAPPHNGKGKPTL